MSEMTIEYNPAAKMQPIIKLPNGMTGVVTPAKIGEKFSCLFRVKLTEKQAIVGFSKFFTIGIGFEVEEKDWNTNLPYTRGAEEIYEHIKVNKGRGISKEKCLKAISMIQAAAAEWKNRKEN